MLKKIFWMIELCGDAFFPPLYTTRPRNFIFVAFLELSSRIIFFKKGMVIHMQESITLGINYNL